MPNARLKSCGDQIPLETFQRGDTVRNTNERTRQVEVRCAIPRLDVVANMPVERGKQATDDQFTIVLGHIIDPLAPGNALA